MIAIAAAETDDELAAFQRVVTGVHPGPGVGVPTLRHLLETTPDAVLLLAGVDDVVVGAGTGMRSSIGDALYAMCRVLPEHRRRGVGTALLAALSVHARAYGCGSLIGRLLEDDAEAWAFAEHRGFTVLSRECRVALDLSCLDDEPMGPPVGVELVSVAERPDLVRAAYEVHATALRDVPVGAEAPIARPFDEWRASTIDAPDALPALSLVALVGDEVVGWSGLEATAYPEVAENGLTGVLPPWRGRGIATALKHEQALRAKRAGLRRIETTNDEANTPMRAVNARLGFEPEPAWLLVRGPLARGSDR